MENEEKEVCDRWKLVRDTGILASGR